MDKIRQWVGIAPRKADYNFQRNVISKWLIVILIFPSTTSHSYLESLNFEFMKDK